MPSARKQDDNGFLLVEGCPISSFGIFEYSAAQLDLPGDPNRIVKVFRPESAVSDPEAIESFKNIPFIIDHEMLSGFENDDSAEAPEDYGIDGVLTSNVYYQAPWMRGDIKMFSRKAQKALINRKRDLSLGYSCKFEVKPGVWNGQQYEVIQHTMRGNHIALVEEGRVPGAKVLDGLIFDHLSFDVVRPSSGENAMSKKAMDATAVERLKALLPALQQFLNEEGQEPEHQENTQAATGSADPIAASTGGEGDEGEAGNEGAGAAGSENADPAGGGDVKALVAEAQALLAKITAAVEGGATEGGENGAAGSEGSDATEGLANEGENHELNANGEAADEGESGAAGGGAEGNGKASPGPAAGKHTQAGDAALGRFYADLAAKDRFYNRVSAVVGAFDSKAMDSRAVVAYGVKKLGIKCAKGTEAIALDAYLTGVEKAKADTKTRVSNSKALDSAAPKCDEIESYINGGK